MILITGGAGFIGSHTVLSLFNNPDIKDKEVVIVDNHTNSNPNIIPKLEGMLGTKLTVYNIDCCDIIALEEVFKKHKITACIHFAGFKAVGESWQIPLEYYNNNMISTLNLLSLLKKYDAKKIIFSSSCTVYGSPASLPITEEFPANDATNPYGRTKLMTEEMLRDIYKAEPDWSIGILRYFNPIGAHESGIIGDLPSGIPNNIMPYISKVACGKLECLPIFGNDYNTHDGTGVRDYIHVMDLAEGHIALLPKILSEQGIFTYNLGTGTGYSVLDLVHAFERVTGQKVKYEIKERRSGDTEAVYGDPTKAFKELGWKCKRNLDDMMRDAWNFEKNLDI